MIRRCAAAVRCGALALTTGLAVSAGLVATAPAVAAPVAQVYKLPYSDVLYEVVGEGTTAVLEPLDYAEWEALGFPGFAVPPTVYVRVSWSPVIYGLSDWPGEHLDLLPDPLTYEEWASVDFPTPVVEDELVAVIKFETSDELFEATPAGEVRKLSFAQWAGAGFPAPEVLANTGFARLTWSPEIGFFLDLAEGLGLPITFEQWQQFDFPTPRFQQRFPGDVFYFESNDSPVVVYEGPTFTGPITEEQWHAAGMPAPEPAPEPGTTRPTVELPQEPGSGPLPLPGQGFVPVS